jgi:hypothetical protein
MQPYFPSLFWHCEVSVEIDIKEDACVLGVACKVETRRRERRKKDKKEGNKH